MREETLDLRLRLIERPRSGTKMMDPPPPARACVGIVVTFAAHRARSIHQTAFLARIFLISSDLNFAIDPTVNTACRIAGLISNGLASARANNYRVSIFREALEGGIAPG